ncbi:hypothetical protein I302_104124 [Kwoniella bestiolae CBS 10118]|uniref:BZIP domain-containing protein n=1 Tax=Kwoniella bestiolae CBS 10118 TaxID=1296100 RepID=A0A1B9GAD2_9TREE|nr:hypothetical protein I302_02832 [Kwoniella bestiolae CBS 10118]OCF27982.1 hypothetical protein I302_02832 [Kwoniella bestiolae CBS 10118]
MSDNNNHNHNHASTSLAPSSTGSNANNNNQNNDTDNDGSGTPKDRHEPRGRKPNDKLPPSRAREVQRAFRLRRAEHLATLEERILHLEQENGSLRALLNLPLADRGRIGSGPTGRGKALKEGGVPMSERVRARKEARERERRALGLPTPTVESSENETHDEMSNSRDMRDSETLSPRASLPPPPPLPTSSSSSSFGQQQHNIQQPLFRDTNTSPQPFNYQLPMPFNLPVSPDPGFADFANSLTNNVDIYKNGNSSGGTGNTPNFGGMFSMFDTPSDQDPSPNNNNNASSSKNTISPISNPQPVQLDLLTRLKSCCHVSDSHVVNDPGLLVYATRLCQQYGCSFAGQHTDSHPRSDNENLTLEDSWRALKSTLEPGGSDPDGENRINTGKMAAELVIRAVNSRSGNMVGNNSNWIMCRFREGLSVKKGMIQALVQGLGGSLE